MKIATKITPAIAEILPLFIESSPKDGPITRSSTILSGVGNAPALSNKATLLASSVEKEPEITPEPWVIGVLITGAVTILLSRTTAKILQDFF